MVFPVPRERSVAPGVESIPDRHASILRLAADWSSENGLNDLTIGRLAQASGMSKAGLHGAFGSKTELQRAVIEFAAGVFLEEVIAPSRLKPAGISRVAAFCEGWISYVDRKVFPGGCFFGRVSMEGAALPTEVSEDIEGRMAMFRKLLTRDLQALDGYDAPRAQELADQLMALLMAYNWAASSRSGVDRLHVSTLIQEKLMGLSSRP